MGIRRSPPRRPTVPTGPAPLRGDVEGAGGPWLARSRAATCLQLRFTGQVHTPVARLALPAEFTTNDTVTE